MYSQISFSIFFLTGALAVAPNYPTLSPELSRGHHQTPFPCSEFSAFLKNEKEIPNLREELFKRGVEENCREKVWPFMFGIYPWNSNEKRRNDIYSMLKSQFDALKMSWHVFDKSVKESEVDRRDKQISEYISDCDTIAVDLPRIPKEYDLKRFNIKTETISTLLHSIVFQGRTRYFQGLDRIISLLLLYLKDEALAYWSFQAIRNKFPDFYKDVINMDPEIKVSRLVFEIISTIDEELAKKIASDQNRDLGSHFSIDISGFFTSTTEIPSEIASIWETIFLFDDSARFQLLLSAMKVERAREIVINENDEGIRSALLLKLPFHVKSRFELVDGGLQILKTFKSKFRGCEKSNLNCQLLKKTFISQGEEGSFLQRLKNPFNKLSKMF